jgi:hypothetical protein
LVPVEVDIIPIEPERLNIEMRIVLIGISNLLDYEILHFLFERENVQEVFQEPQVLLQFVTDSTLSQNFVKFVLVAHQVFRCLLLKVPTLILRQKLVFSHQVIQYGKHYRSFLLSYEVHYLVQVGVLLNQVSAEYLQLICICDVEWRVLQYLY